MNNIDDFFETGSFIVELDGHFLGCGKTILSMAPAMREIRRDALRTIRGRQIKKINFSINTTLSCGDNVWKLLENNDDESFAEKVFLQGTLLRLYPTDRFRSGYEFKRVFLERLLHTSDSTTESNRLLLTFSGEIPLDGKSIFTRLPDNSLPKEYRERAVDLQSLKRDLIRFLGEKLDAIPDKSIRADFFAPPPYASYMLSLEQVSSWHLDIPQLLEFKLTARFPFAEKNRIDQKLYNTAQTMHEQHLTTGTKHNFICKVKSLDYSGRKLVSGSTVTDSILRFSLLL